MINAGELNKRLTIQAKGLSRDTTGGTKESYTDVSTVWGSISYLTGREYFQASQDNADRTVKIKIRHFQGLSVTHRIAYGHQRFDIEAIQPDAKKTEMLLICLEVL